jgi:hypothetical protein
VQGLAGAVERVAGAAAVIVQLLLDPTATPVQGVAGEADHVERFRHRDVSGGSSVAAVLRPVAAPPLLLAAAGEPVRRDDLQAFSTGVGAGGEPGLERLLGTAFDHVQQP